MEEALGRTEIGKARKRKVEEREDEWLTEQVKRADKSKLEPNLDARARGALPAQEQENKKEERATGITEGDLDARARRASGARARKQERRKSNWKQ
jgi:hypothetical protein